MKEYKLIVAGSRDWDNEKLALNSIVDFQNKYAKERHLHIISGTARGADQMGEEIAQRFHLPLTRMPADWDTHGKSAGYQRNEQMAAKADGALILWDGQSRGSKHMYDLAVKYCLDVELVLPTIYRPTQPETKL